MQHEAAAFTAQDGPVDGKRLEEWVMQDSGLPRLRNPVTIGSGVFLISEELSAKDTVKSR